jgi:hypothetical protein
MKVKADGRLYDDSAHDYFLTFSGAPVDRLGPAR